MQIQIKQITLLLLVLFSSVLLAQKKEATNNKFVLADVIQTTIVIVDTANPTVIASEYSNLHRYKMSKNMMYLETQKFNLFISQLKKIVYNKNAIINIWCFPSDQINRKAIVNFFRNCDTLQVEEFDKNGNSFLRYSIRCDSTSIFDNITSIEFYEKWIFNEQNGMIEKEVIAYTPLRQTEKDFLMPLYTVYRNKESLKLITESSQ